MRAARQAQSLIATLTLYWHTELIFLAGDVCVYEIRRIRAHAPREISAANSCDRHAALDLKSYTFRMS